MRIVLDTDVVIAAMRSPTGASAAILRLVRQQQVTLPLNAPSAIEYGRPQLRDPNDEMVLQAAINGRAAALVTFNLRHYGTVPARCGVDLLLPRDALRRLRP
ncbi:MAG: PIN domain-containing protein [Acidobacteriia bacterium]|nr:PIN domain-containing protein [Terriglobia bacterium]